MNDDDKKKQVPPPPPPPPPRWLQEGFTKKNSNKSKEKEQDWLRDMCVKKLT